MIFIRILQKVYGIRLEHFYMVCMCSHGEENAFPPSHRIKRVWRGAHCCERSLWGEPSPSMNPSLICCGCQQYV